MSQQKSDFTETVTESYFNYVNAQFNFVHRLGSWFKDFKVS